ncbi:YiiX/YebB-like N1pC/P60 family cysteine hydrolase [Luteolibacter marinus]|uniref:YiiX/YebB-like N1pC/P60 family cysteine hydrolase n=1 Tax=Luteolibacter marinus TaxID=2776705 RepID=UPI001867509F|nr:YiiX/YebB-like N1pC/P60 family cysteine hydrolase [Luteolibacter marinus]
MKSLAALLSLIAAGIFIASVTGRENPEPEAIYALQEGDIVFHGNAGGQSDAIREATGSPYTHCGVVFRKDGRLMVFEAVQPVRAVPVEAFIARSQPGTFHARRLKNPPRPEAIAEAKAWAAKQSGRNYDYLFQWADGALYCSELVWKVYDRAGIQLCPTRHFQDYQLDSPKVREVIKRRYGSVDKLPRDEPVVAPGDLAASPLLVEVPRVAE